MSIHFLFPKPAFSAGNNDQKDQDGDVDMFVRAQRDNFESKVVTPGQVITADTQYMRGHGTYLNEEESSHISSVAGVVERVNKLITVRPLHTRYTGNIGDLVIGRITEVTNKRWKVDINSRQDAVLLLSAINLPGGVQRRKTEADELQMRKFFAEGDLLAAEFQGSFNDGSTSLHTRNLKYGKLRNGSLIVVPPALVQRCKTHFHTLSCGVDVTLGLNGYIWVSKHSSKNLDELDPEAIYSNDNEPVDRSTRETIARVCNCINALSRHFMCITDTIIAYAYEASLKYPVKDLLKLEAMEFVTTEVRHKLSVVRSIY
ncbi:Exosome complex component RRP4 [Gigaspora margarita]|uniref:Exosome complex component RRP4 n=1 Tax=Gigaspora margarita TaxID=4874 RepID=A0A8H4AFT3_GIGMA|nr:Exosome complex component RRP4 [Gigaspora margarita]